MAFALFLSDFQGAHTGVSQTTFYCVSAHDDAAIVSLRLDEGQALERNVWYMMNGSHSVLWSSLR